MLHPDTELRFVNDVIGYGVFATRLIPKGSITWVLDPLDRAFDDEAVSRLDDELRRAIEKYSWRDRDGYRVLCWDFGRYMNHSCDANSLSPGLDFEIAVRDVAPGEELTCEYGALNLETTLECLCGCANCRRIIRPEDFERYAERWDSLIRDAFPLIARCPQPLWSLVREKSEVAEAILNPESIPSILTHRHSQEPALMAGVLP